MRITEVLRQILKQQMETNMKLEMLNKTNESLTRELSAARQQQFGLERDKLMFEKQKWEDSQPTPDDLRY